MIVTRLTGGLGNQMFQYALGRRLAHDHSTDLYLDVTSFAAYGLRKYELDIFRIHALFASQDLLKCVPFSRKDVLRTRMRNLVYRKTELKYIQESTLDFDERMLSLPNNTYIDGYWQNEKYFVDISDIIKKEFSFANPPSPVNQEILDKIKGCNSISLHFRRGDYVTNLITLEYHGLVGIEYYMAGLKLIGRKIEDPQIFVFSDDIAWVKDNFKTDLSLHFIEHNVGEKSYEDLRLMSNCKHHIIANSSFSWWGAWLSSYGDKLIIAPKNWFSDEKWNNEQNIVPSNWIKI